jgi:hypothetical protein
MTWPEALIYISLIWVVPFMVVGVAWANRGRRRP